MGKIPVMEIFGPTIQGEGMAIGQKTMFVRTGGCDYQCAWCDSKFTWDGTQKSTMMQPVEIWAALERMGENRFQYVTLSGGNPALIGDPMAELISLLHSKSIRVGLETQGSKWQAWFVDIDDLTLSPKPPSSRMETNWSLLEDIVKKLQESKANFSFKIVVFDTDDYAYAAFIRQKWPTVPLFLSVGNDDVVEEGDIAIRLLDRMRWLTDLVVHDESMKNVRVLPQLHALLWGNKRGV